MDSKYSSIGNNKVPNGIKRTNPFSEKLITTKKKKHGKLKIIVKQDDVKKGNEHNSGSVQESSRDLKNNLPVYAARNRLLEEIKQNETMILIGETGSGKTTQVPQIIHGARLEATGMIGITQPRRVAAITIALRVASEMDTQPGLIVGYSVRFEDVSGPRTKVKYLTDGMLLREAMADSLLKNYSVIILDEAHERTVSTDVLFGIVKLAQKDRKEQKLNPLKIIIMSATMDVDTFSRYFNDCPVVYLEGRTYPVTIYHSKTKHEDYLYAAVCTIFQLHSIAPPRHDFLVFLTGQEEIETVMYNIKQIAKEVNGPAIKVCPLYAGLPAAKQLQVWKDTPVGSRKIVLATNIAEASVTIPNIKYVIDSGMVKERSWCRTSGADRLVVSRCAQAASWQRAGRAGRDSPGHAYRLYTKFDFDCRPAYAQPEILRCPLASTLLSLIAMGVDPSTFPLINTPSQESIAASLKILIELGAVVDEANPKTTVLGKRMSAFPIDPKYSKILLSAPEYECLDEALSLVAVLSSENVFHSPMHKREEALKVKQKFNSPLGDHITLLNVFKAFCKAPLKKQWCKENYLHHKNLTYAFEVRQQLLRICQRFNLTVESCGQNYDKLLKCLLSGLRSNCAWLRAERGGGGARYVTRGGVGAVLHPGGVLGAVRPPPPALLYSDLLTTRRTYLLTVSAIDPHWVQQTTRNR